VRHARIGLLRREQAGCRDRRDDPKFARAGGWSTEILNEHQVHWMFIQQRQEQGTPVTAERYAEDGRGTADGGSHVLHRRGLWDEPEEYTTERQPAV
jgi:hypothetical protein